MTIYLLVKTHLKTGLQYLCQTKQEPFKYLGSGIYWRRHLKTHGKEISTHILRECNDRTEVEYWGRYYSDLWNVVESAYWANLKPETGDGGSNGGTPRIKTSLTMKGRTAHNKGKKQVHKKHKSRSKSTTPKTINKIRSDAGISRPKIKCPHCDKHVDKGNYARYHGDNCKFIEQ
jgi:hypothetical protein